MALKIEEEFGIFVPRLFQSMSLDIVPESDNDALNNHRIILLEFIGDSPEEQDKDELKKLMIEHGGSSLKSCLPLSERQADFGNVTLNQRKENCWVVEYKKSSDADRAYRKLRAFDGVKVSFPLQTLTKSFDKNIKNTDEEIKKVSFEYRITRILYLFGRICVVASSIAFISLAFQKMEEPVSCLFNIQ